MVLPIAFNVQPVNRRSSTRRGLRFQILSDMAMNALQMFTHFLHCGITVPCA